MGMTNDNVERESLVETNTPIKKKKEEPLYNMFGIITIKNQMHAIYTCIKDHYIYKAPKIGEYRHDPLNNSPLVAEFGEITQLKKEDFI